MLHVIHGKRIAALLLAAALIFSLAACGEDTPDAGRYLCVSAESGGFAFEPEELFPGGAAVELGTGGQGILTLGAESGSLRWSLSGTEVALSLGGVHVPGTLRDGELSFTLPESGVRLRFLREDLYAAVTPEPDPERYEQAIALWCGDWFGRWSVHPAAGSFADTWYDCCAVLSPTEDGRHLLLTLWDEDGSRGEPMARVEFAVEPGDGAADRGAAASTRGSFWFGEIGPGEWRLEMDGGPYPDMLSLQGRHDSGTEVFDYEILLRPWGRLWDDVQRDDSYALPFRYEWYLTMIETGQAMPDSLPDAA
ncbi:MAG: hypothetical protein IJ594_00765 [Oscillospiraceae bacterium]|nr:hypothetical protein [Oscillospiraceae bacterium]